MKRFRLSREPAVGVVALAVVALIAGTIGMWAFQHRAELQELHERLTRDADEMVRELDVFKGKMAEDNFSNRFVPLDLKQTLLQVQTERAQLLYRSRHLVSPITEAKESVLIWMPRDAAID